MTFWLRNDSKRPTVPGRAAMLIVTLVMTVTPMAAQEPDVRAAPPSAAVHSSATSVVPIGTRVRITGSEGALADGLRWFNALESFESFNYP